MYSDKYTIPTEWTTRWKDLNTKTQVCENLQTKANSVDDSWIPSNFDIKTDCLDFFTTIQESYSDQYSRCLEEEKKCDKWCAPWVPSPGVYWKANRNFEVPVVSIDIIFTNVGYSEGAIADVAEAAAQLYLNDNVQTATIGYNVKAGVYGDQTVDIRLDGYGDKIDELYKSVDGYFASVSNYLSQGRDSIKSYYEELNKKLDA